MQPKATADGPKEDSGKFFIWGWCSGKNHAIMSAGYFSRAEIAPAFSPQGAKRLGAMPSCFASTLILEPFFRKGHVAGPEGKCRPDHFWKSDFLCENVNNL